MTRTLLGMLLALTVAACGGKSPTEPTPSGNTATRILQLEGNMAFGTIPVGQSFEAILRMYNRGNAVLTITGMTGPSGFTSTWTSGQIQPGTSQAATIKFSPTEARTYNGTLTVNGDQTSGANTLPISGTGLRDLFRRSGIGNTVFDMPTDVRRVHITGNLQTGCENFIVHIGGQHVVNEILGTCSVASGRAYDGIHLTVGGVVEIVSSNGVSWSFEEVR